MENNNIVLIASKNTNLLQNFCDMNFRSLQILDAQSPEDMQETVTDLNFAISALALDADFSNPYCIPLIKFCRELKPELPIFLFSSEPQKLPDEEIRQGLHINTIFMNPLIPAAILTRILRQGSFPSTPPFGLLGQNREGVGEEVDSEETNMHPVQAKCFLAGQTTFFDVYVRLSPWKFIRILRAGEAFELSRLQLYLSKGNHWFFIKKEAQLQYLDFCDHVTKTILSKQELGLEIKEQQLLNLDQNGR